MPKKSRDRFDSIVIGAGHNGLITAAYLASAGQNVAVFERRGVVGGACCTAPIFKDVSFSLAASWAGMLRREIIEDFELEKRGLELNPCNPQIVSLSPDGNHFVIYLDDKETVENLKENDCPNRKKDAHHFLEFMSYCEELSDTLDEFLTHGDANLSELINSLKDKKQDKSIIDITTQSVSSVLSRYFKSPIVQSTLAMDAIAIRNTSPGYPGTAYHLFYMMTARIGGSRMTWGTSTGGMGKITELLLEVATDKGANVFTDSPVKEIELCEKCVSGVVLEDGRRFLADRVISSADPKTTINKLLPQDEALKPLQEKVAAMNSDGQCTIIHFHLKSLPALKRNQCSLQSPLIHSGMTIIAPDLEYITQAHHEAAIERKIPTNPILTIGVPSIKDKTLVADNSEIMSVLVQFTPYSVCKENPSEARALIIKNVLYVLEKYYVGFESLIKDYVMLTPIEIERLFGMPGGHPEHLEMQFDQLFEERPSQCLMQENGILSGLYLCGAGTHPGGTVTGLPGFRAAKHIVNEVQNTYN